MKVSQYGKVKELSTFLQGQSQKPSSTMTKLALVRTATGMEDPELPLLQRISSLELPASEIAAQINASQSSSNRHISTSTVRRLSESGLHGQIAAKKPLQNIYVYIYSGAKKYFVSHQLCKFSHLKRRERPVIFIIGTSTMTDKMSKKNPENHIVGFFMNLFANYGGK